MYRYYITNLHELSLQVRTSALTPGQLLFSVEAAGFWQSRVLVWVPVPQVNVQDDQADHGVHPTAPESNNTIIS